MGRYRMENNTIVDSDNASKTWDEAKFFDGNNMISRATGSQWDHQQLHRSKRGRYWVESWSQWQGSRPHAEWVSPREAALWLINNEHDDDIPKELQELVEEVVE